MSNQFDELTKSMAQSVTRRAALKKFGVGLAGMALACFGLVSQARAAKQCVTSSDCSSGQVCNNGVCTDIQSLNCQNCIAGCMLLSNKPPHGVCLNNCKQQGYC